MRKPWHSKFIVEVRFNLFWDHSRTREYPLLWIYDIYSRRWYLQIALLWKHHGRDVYYLLYLFSFDRTRIYSHQIARSIRDVLREFLQPRKGMRMHLCRSLTRILGHDARRKRKKKRLAWALDDVLKALGTTNKTFSGNWMLTGTSFASFVSRLDTSITNARNTCGNRN